MVLPSPPHSLLLLLPPLSGPMVLFTSPDDMVIGRSCQVHQREVTSKQAARELRTTENLVNTALNYKSEKVRYLPTGTNHLVYNLATIVEPTVIFKFWRVKAQRGHYQGPKVSQLIPLDKASNFI